MNEKNDHLNFSEVLKPKEEVRKDDNKKENNIAKNFPDWDLLPPYQTVRRIVKK